MRQEYSEVTMLLSILFFILAGLAEIGGGYLVWLYMRDDKGPIYLIAGAFILFLQHTAAYSSPSLFYGAGLWTACDQICMILSVVSCAL